MSWLSLKLLSGMAVATVLIATACSGEKEAAQPSALCQGDIGIGDPEDSTSRLAAQMAIDQFLEQNKQCKVNLVTADVPITGGDEAVKALEPLMQNPQVLGLIGPPGSQAAIAAGGVIDAANLPFIVTGTGAETLSQQGWSTFHRLNATDNAAAAASVRYITNFLRLDKVFIVNNATVYGKGLSQEMSKELPPVGTAEIQVNQNPSPDLIPKIIASGANVVFCACYGVEAGKVVKELRAAGSSVPYVGGQGLMFAFTDTAGAAAEGSDIISYTIPVDEAQGNFANDFQAKFGVEPGALAVEAYASTQIYLAGIKAGKNDRAALNSFVSAFEGETIVGPIKFTPQGDLEPDLEALWAYKVQNGAVKFVTKLYAIPRVTPSASN